LVPLPQGTTIIPSEYAIFLSNEDDKEWQGVKRKGLEQGLYHILAERAKEIAGKKKLETKSFVLELRVDGTLEKGELRVQHSWEDSTNNKTGVLARPKPTASELKYKAAEPERRKFDPDQTQAAQSQDQIPSTPNFTQSPAPRAYEPPPTMPGSSIQQAVPLPAEDAEIMTHVQTRAPELYRLEIWRNGVRQNVVPIYQREVSIGRGSKSKPVDLSLAGDAEISRRHVTLITDGTGNYWVVNEGRNPAMINNYELASGQRVPLKPGVSLAVCSYILRIQPR
jgi:hypothetical protein